ncbi:MAG: hypothetical protein KDJ74_08435 [Notoacmeibacter sp.]|nr:hypothetical protein [Notoacmeibacter sp.]
MKKIVLAIIASTAFATGAVAMEPAKMTNNGPNAGNGGYEYNAGTPMEGVDMMPTASIRGDASAAEQADKPAIDYGPTVDKFDIYTGK